MDECETFTALLGKMNGSVVSNRLNIHFAIYHINLDIKAKQYPILPLMPYSLCGLPQLDNATFSVA